MLPTLAPVTCLAAHASVTFDIAHFLQVAPSLQWKMPGELATEMRVVCLDICNCEQVNKNMWQSAFINCKKWQRARNNYRYVMFEIYTVQ